MAGTSLRDVVYQHNRNIKTQTDVRGDAAGQLLMKTAMQGTQQEAATLNITVLGVEMRKFIPGVDDPGSTTLWIP